MTPPELQASGKEMVMHSTAKNDSVAARCSRSRSAALRRRLKFDRDLQACGTEEKE
jgi:hypothetical protein